MLHYVFIGLTWLIGTVGVAGAVAIIVAVIYLGPAAVLAIIEPLFARFIACIPCIVFVVFVLATTGAYWIGHHQEAKQCKAAELAAALRNTQIDRDNAVKAKADETNRANQIETDANDQRRKDLADIALLKNRPATCAFDDTDAGSLPDNKSGSGNAHPPAGSDKAGEGSAGAVPHKRLLLPMVRHSWLPWRGRKSDAAPHQ